MRQYKREGGMPSTDGRTVKELLRNAKELCADRIGIRLRLAVPGYDSYFHTFPEKAEGEWLIDGLKFVLAPKFEGRTRLFVRCPACYRNVGVGKFAAHADKHLSEMT